MSRPFKSEFSIFLVVGLLTVGIDFAIYWGLIYLRPFLLEDINVAKGISFIGGTIFAYFANRYWTFKQQKTSSGSIPRFALVYVLGLIANIVINYLSLFWFGGPLIVLDFTLLIAFILATGVSATINFFGMKFFVFTTR